MTDEDILYEEKLVEQRHTELLDAFELLTLAISNFKKDDPELKRLISDNSKAINDFGKIPEVKVETNQDKVVEELGKLIKIMVEAKQDDNRRMKIMEDRISLLEKKPLPTKLRAERDDYLGTINYVIVEYQK